MNTQNPFETGEKKIPGLLNVLTILTLIGVSIELFFNVLNLVSGRKNLDRMEEMEASGQMDNVPEFLKPFAGPEALENARLAYENRIPLFIIALAGFSLCAYGALQMRKLHKTGYFTYLIGQALPILGSLIFIGTGFIGNMGFFLAFPVIFIILYTTQLKHLK